MRHKTARQALFGRLTGTAIGNATTIRLVLIVTKTRIWNKSVRSYEWMSLLNSRQRCDNPTMMYDTSSEATLRMNT